jgi:hypothetical protein
MDYTDNTSQLAKYEALAKDMTGETLHYALEDVKATLPLWNHTPMSHPYHAKLWAEFDAYTVETHKRKNLSR